MKVYPNIRYDFRPASYWDDSDPLHSILRNVKGENRRQMILDYARDGRLEELDPELLRDEVGEGTRQRLGRIHPSFMGGEYLPGYLPGEVEIARICLCSTMSDVISVRARPTAAGTIAYRVVDEYEAAFSLPIKESDRTLTLEDMIRQLDKGGLENEGFAEGGLSLGYNNLNADSADFEALRHFTRITSSSYPQLCTHYEHVFEDWVVLNVTERDRDK